MAKDKKRRTGFTEVFPADCRSQTERKKSEKRRCAEGENKDCEVRVCLVLALTKPNLFQSMSLPGTPRRPQVIDTFDDEDEEDDIYLPEAEKSKPDAQKAAEDDAEEAALLEDEATNKQAAFSAQINEDMR